MIYAPVNYDINRYMPDPLRRYATQLFEEAGKSARLAGESARAVDIPLYVPLYREKTGYG